MKIIAIDTATEACSAALYLDGLYTGQFKIAPRQHTQLILQMIDDLLRQAGIKIADLDALAFGRGPGSFTGVRIATGIVQGLAFANDLPVIPVSTLASIAQFACNKHQQKNIIAGIDARMGEMYWGCYRQSENGLMILDGVEQVTPASEVSVPDSQVKWLGAGTAWQSYSEELERCLSTQISEIHSGYLPTSSSIAQLAVYEYEQGRVLEASQALPVYLRNNVAKKSARGVFKRTSKAPT
ncbi:tRNA threonylcarbamoyladenosine biosynthesis protein TsaB [hydrothermal vent metagenome]|uniref:tRNA threonylcarbamoyladenosine biosynthesis protein TsaB n=1 Tax=hydrothermal vent metagenome TaxID=652676 RepID=A0A3B0Y8Q1_9ZZZZ